MATPVHSLTYRGFMKSLAGGMVVLAISAWLWLMAATWCAVCAQQGIDPFTPASNVDIPATWLLPSLAVAMPLILSAIRIRRRAHGFKWSDLYQAGTEYASRGRRIRVRFLQIALTEWLLIAMAVLLGLHFHRIDLVWPGVSLIVSAHFAPLAHLFRLKPYYATALAGSLVSLAGLVIPSSSITTAHRLLVVSLGVGATMALTGGYFSVRAEELARDWEGAV
jgi:hypothetical protein